MVRLSQHRASRLTLAHPSFHIGGWKEQARLLTPPPSANAVEGKGHQSARGESQGKAPPYKASATAHSPRLSERCRRKGAPSGRPSVLVPLGQISWVTGAAHGREGAPDVAPLSTPRSQWARGAASHATTPRDLSSSPTAGSDLVGHRGGTWEGSSHRRRTPLYSTESVGLRRSLP